MSSNGVLQSPLITILVGPQESKFEVHQDVLAKCWYFCGCLAAGFPEGESKTIKMPEDDPTTFACVLEFVYFGTIPYNLDEETLRPRVYHERSHASHDEEMAVVKKLLTASRGLIKVHKLADKLGIEGLVNATHDSTQRIHKNLNPAVVDLYTNMTEKDDKLRQFAVKQMAWHVKELGWNVAKEQLKGIWSKFMEKSSENAIELFEAYTTLKAGKNSRAPALWKDKCQWHVHIDTPKCSRQSRMTLLSKP